MQGMFRTIALYSGLGIAFICAFFLISHRGDYLFIRLLSTNGDMFSFARVIDVTEKEYRDSPAPYYIQTISARIVGQDDSSLNTTVHYRGLIGSDSAQKIRIGETIVLVKNNNFEGGDAYFIADRYYLPAFLGIGILFFIAVVVCGGLRGLSSFMGLIASVAILLLYIAPALLSGHNALLVSFVGASCIGIVSLYLGHGLSIKTTIALIATLITLSIASGFAMASVHVTGLMGIASEESFLLNLKIATLNIRGLLLAGIVIGMMGVLDDVTTGQTAAVYELRQANPQLGFKELYRRGTAIGREHIASLVNTLVLAYAGASLPVFLYLIVQSEQSPWWMVLNQSIIAEEIVRTLVGSMALVLAVPITTSLAAYYYGKYR